MAIDLALVSASAAQQGGCAQGARLTQRIFLYPNELYRVPSTYRQVRTRNGIAHISHGGRDLIVQPGECVSLDHVTDAALVSPLRGETLVLELFQ